MKDWAAGCNNRIISLSTAVVLVWIFSRLRKMAQLEKAVTKTIQMPRTRLTRVCITIKISRETFPLEAVSIGKWAWASSLLAELCSAMMPLTMAAAKLRRRAAATYQKINIRTKKNSKGRCQ